MSLLQPTAAPTRRRSWIAPAAGVATVVLLGARTLIVDATAWEWFETVRRPGWGLAPLLLGVGWFLVVASGVPAAWIVAARDAPDTTVALTCWTATMTLALVWMWLVFWSAALVPAAGVAVLLLFGAVLSVAGAARVSRLAAVLMVPTLVWSVAVAVLAGGLAVLN